jgi:ComF family protein
LTFSLFHSLLSAFLPLYELLYPPICVVCNRPRGSNEKVCSLCWSQLKEVTTGDALFQRALELLKSSEAIHDLVTAFYFEKDGPLQSVIHLLKYGNMPSLGVELGKRLSGRVMPLLEAHSITGIIPVPLHRVKERERGYNQAFELCRGLSVATRLECFPTLLKRSRYTESQTLMNAQERVENVSGAFAVPRSLKARVAGRSFLLVDDVVTTGATMIASASALKDSGATSIIACSVAIAELT